MNRWRYVMRMDLEHHMRLAIDEAKRGRRAGAWPFGAVLVDPMGHAVAASGDAARCNHDPTDHADARLIRAACAHLGRDLAGCTLYTTCEPCALCFTSAWLARVSRVVYGATLAEVRAKTGGLIDQMPVTARAMNRAGGDRIDLIGGVLGEECLELFDAATARRAATGGIS